MTSPTIARRFFVLAMAAALVAGGLAGGLAGGPARGQPAPAAAPRPAQIDRNGVLVLIRGTLIALQQANETGNYTVLRDLGAPDFQQANTAARLGEVFAKLRGQNLDLSGIMVLDPQLTLLPQIEGNGVMHMAGFFPSVPTQIDFELFYAPVNRRWRILGLSVGLGSASPVAPAPSQPATPPPPAASAPAKQPPTSRPRHKAPPKPLPAEPLPQ